VLLHAAAASDSVRREATHVPCLAWHGTRVQSSMRSDRKWSLASLALAISASIVMFVATRFETSARVGAQETARAEQPALQCYEHARKRTLLADGPAFLLCRGARSTAPAQCYDAGRKETGLTNRQLFELCRCASSSAPVRCFERAHRETFLLDERIVALCSPIVTENLSVNCEPAE
jgi:hypothetical protein